MVGSAGHMQKQDCRDQLCITGAVVDTRRSGDRGQQLGPGPTAGTLDATGTLEHCVYRVSHIGHTHLLTIWWDDSFLSHLKGDRARAGPRADVGALAVRMHFCGCRVSPRARCSEGWLEESGQCVQVRSWRG